MNVRFDTIKNSDGTEYDRTANASGNWQVIFKTKDDLDYCRETKPGSWSREKIKKWTEIAVNEYGLGGAVIQKW